MSTSRDQSSKPQKNNYRSPRLHRYGALMVSTQSKTSTSSDADNPGQDPTNKTGGFNPSGG
jgi:hypothetical protein